MENLVRILFIILLGIKGFSQSLSYADIPNQGLQYLHDAEKLYHAGQYFQSARYAFASQKSDPTLRPISYSWMTIGLLKAGLPNAASYFFIRTLQTGNQTAIRLVLTYTQDLLNYVGADLLRKYLVLHTHYEDYDVTNRSVYFYVLGKEALLAGNQQLALEYLNHIREYSSIWPFSLQLKASSLAILGRNQEAITHFKKCANESGRNEDLKFRCMAGEARTLYQSEQFEEADRVYDQISKKSFVWPDILFEQAWNAFGLREYNRTLGKLVSYKSPALGFVFNSEIEVLRAQAFLALCLYADANQVIREFHSKYTFLGAEVKRFIEQNQTSLPAFYRLGKEVLYSSLYTENRFYQLINRFIRGPYFRDLVAQEKKIQTELSILHHLDSTQSGVSHDMQQGFPGFLNQVLHWRIRSIHLLGGAFVKNSLLDYYTALVDDLEKMDFIKLEVLKAAKNKLIDQKMEEDRSRGNIEPSRREDQYRWIFNGEFWNDELGDYVFGLESECKS